MLSNLTDIIYLEGQVDATPQVGQDGEGREGHQHSADHMTGDPPRDHQEQGVGTVHHLLQIEGHTAGERREK